MTAEAAEAAGLLTADEAADLLRCSVRTLRRLRSRGAIADVWVSENAVRIPRQSVEDFKRLGGLTRGTRRASPGSPQTATRKDAA